MSKADTPSEQRRPGRPRKWPNEAERVRAYRQRKAEEHANADELRVEHRVLKRQLTDAIRGRARAEASLERATKRADALAAELALLGERLDRAESEIRWARAKNEELL